MNRNWEWGEILWRISRNSSLPFSSVVLTSLYFNDKSYFANVSESLVFDFAWLDHRRSQGGAKGVMAPPEF